MLNKILSIFQGFMKAASRPARYLGLIEKLILCRGWVSERPQLFIMGLPRSGTTLVYQYIAHRVNVAYFTNGVGNYPWSPCLISKLQRLFFGEYVSNFESNYGKVRGSVAPREAGSFWGRFFSLNDYVSASDIDQQKARNLKRTVSCMQAIFGDVVFVNKNVKHLLRIDALAKIFPKSVFLIIDRNVEDVAISLLRGRHENVGGSSQWWSVRPERYQELLNLNPYQQIAWQVTLLKERMEKDLSALPQDRVIRISYEDFCAHPEALIHNVISKLGATETHNSPVQQFECRKNSQQSSEEVLVLTALQGLANSRGNRND